MPILAIPTAIEMTIAIQIETATETTTTPRTLRRPSPNRCRSKNPQVPRLIAVRTWCERPLNQARNGVWQIPLDKVA
jgi:hypothetical protein